MKCNQICKWNSNAGCVKPYGVPCILENVSPTDKKATNADCIRAMRNEEVKKAMREILFRGKRLYDGEWIEGHLIQYEDGRARICESNTDIFCYEKDRSIIQTVAHEVDPFTIGQYTGLTDKNGKRIFEGDILHIAKIADGLGRYYQPQLDYPVNVVVKWDLCAWMWETLCDDKRYITFPDAWCHYECELIGNIHDNPELLDGGVG